MRTFIATKHDQPWVITFKFNDAELLIGFELPEDWTEEKVKWIMDRMPLNITELEPFSRISKLKIEEQITEVTFDYFYNPYAVKEARQKAEKSWERLSKAERIKAFKYIPVLRSKCNLSGIAMPYPATYLNNKRWND